MARRNQNTAVETTETTVEPVVNETATIGQPVEQDITEGTIVPDTTEVEQPAEVQEAIQEVRDAKPGMNPILRDYDLDALKAQFKTKSGLIRYLDSQGYKRADIAKALGLLYQHVRNVLTQPVKTDRAEQPNPEAARRQPAANQE